LVKTRNVGFTQKFDIAYTIVDEPLLPPEMHLTTDFAYFRWHGRGEKIWFDYRYSNEELDPWVPKVQEASKSVKKVIGSSIITITATHPKTAYTCFNN